MNAILLRRERRHISASHVAFFRVYKYVCSVTVKNRVVLIKIPVKWQNSDDYKIF
jgi:hypothetical protein